MVFTLDTTGKKDEIIRKQEQEIRELEAIVKALQSGIEKLKKIRNIKKD